jgi:hypothetical protein
MTGGSAVRSAIKVTSTAYRKAREILEPIMPGISIDAALKAELTPDDRGVLVIKVSNVGPKVRILGHHLSLFCVRGTDTGEEDSFIAIDCAESSPSDFARRFSMGVTIEGEWVILLPHDRRPVGPFGSEAWEIIGAIPCPSEDHYEYWRRLREMLEEQEELIQERESRTPCRFDKARALADQNLIELHLLDTHLNAELKEGTVVRIQLTDDAATGKPAKLTGTVYELRKKTRLLIEPSNREVYDLFRLQADSQETQGRRGVIKLDWTGDRAILNRQRRALRRLTHRETANPRLVELIPCCKNAAIPDPVPAPPLPYHHNILTERQREAIDRALAAPDIYLVQGPPGTGKTTVISEILYQLTATGKSVLICSQSHVAVDNALQRIGHLPHVRAMRIGDKGRVEATCEKYLLRNAVETWQRQIIERASENLSMRDRLQTETASTERKIKLLNEVVRLLYRYVDLRRRSQSVENQLEECRRRLDQALTRKQHLAKTIAAIERSLGTVQSGFCEYQEALSIMASTGLTLEGLKQRVAYALVFEETSQEEISAESELEKILGYRPTKLAVSMIEDQVAAVRANSRSLSGLAKTLENFETVENLVERHDQLEREQEIIRELESQFEHLTSQQRSLIREEELLWNGSSPLAVFAEEYGVDRNAVTEETAAFADSRAAELRTLLSTCLKHRQTKEIVLDWIETLSSYQGSLEQVYIDNTNVVAATCMGIARGSDNVFVDKEFDVVVIDESARSSPAELLVPMIRGRRIVLVGDHRQLPPQKDNELERRLEEKGTIASGEIEDLFRESLFQRLYTSVPEALRSFLDIQFRMHGDISELVRGFYDDMLRDGPDVSLRDHGLSELWPAHAYWISTSGLPTNKEIRRSQQDTSCANQADIDVISSLLSTMDAEYSKRGIVAKKTVGVITGYAYQRELLREALLHRMPTRWQNIELEIGTIDAFQGREKNIVIVSLVRTNAGGIVGFIAHDPRVNVALSRAQELLFVVGDAEFISKFSDKAGELASTLERLRYLHRLVPASAILKR